MFLMLVPVTSCYDKLDEVRSDWLL